MGTNLTPRLCMAECGRHVTGREKLCDDCASWCACGRRKLTDRLSCRRCSARRAAELRRAEQARAELERAERVRAARGQTPAGPTLVYGNGRVLVWRKNRRGIYVAR